MIIRSKLLTILTRYVSHTQKHRFAHNISCATKEKQPESFLSEETGNGIKNKIALVTRGSDGIGLRCVKELLKCGAKAVMITGTNEKIGLNRITELGKKYGMNRVGFIKTHPASETLLKNAFVSTIKCFEALHIVINNIKFKESKDLQEQLDESVKATVLSSRLSIEYMGRDKGGCGGSLVNVASAFNEDSKSCSLFLAVQDFIVGYDRSIASEHFDTSDVKVLTICQATPASVRQDLVKVISKGKNGCIWVPAPLNS